MDKILDIIHTTIAVFITIIAAICLDLPLKLLLCGVFIVLSVVFSIFYPLIRKIEMPDWVDTIYDFATRRHLFIASKVWDMWYD